MRRRSKTLVLFTIAILLTLPFLKLPNTIVKADPPEYGWQRITDNDFSENNNNIRQLTTNGPAALWLTTNNIFMSTDGEEYDTIADSITGDGNYLDQMAIVGPLLFATTDGTDGPKLWSSTGLDEWTDQTSIFEGLDLVAIRYMAPYQGQLLFQIVHSNEEGTWSSFYTYNGGSPVEIPNGGSFSELDTYYFNTENIVAGAGDTAYALIHDGSTNDYYVYSTEGEGWTLVSSFAPGTYVDNIVYFNDTLYVYMDQTDGDPGLHYLEDDVWVEIDNDFFHASENKAVFSISEGALFMGISNYTGDPARIVGMSDDNLLAETNDHVGVLSEVEGENYNYITAMVVSAVNIILGAGLPGEGPSNAALWIYGPAAEDDDSDGDGVLDSIEDAGPNDGDANDDSIADSSQANVTTIYSDWFDDYMTLETSCESNTNVQNGGESSEDPDAAFDYHFGLTSYILDCELGETADIAFYFYGDHEDPSLYVARKWIDEEYVTITSAEFISTTISGQPVLKMGYQVTDGGEFDDDGDENGTIVDPVGPALNAAGVPNTGLGGKATRVI